MSVRELLATHTSYELSEWRAFDLVYGLPESQVADVLADIHEQLQLMNHMFGAANFTPESKPEENPVSPPESYKTRKQRYNEHVLSGEE